jgi:hypothetical protein
MTLPTFDRSRLRIKPLAERVHDLSIAQQLGLDDLPPPLPEAVLRDLEVLGRRMQAARARGAAVLLLMGGHVIRAGVARHLIDLMQRGLITHIGMDACSRGSGNTCCEPGQTSSSPIFVPCH